jgi:hypothetical protein
MDDIFATGAIEKLYRLGISFDSLCPGCRSNLLEGRSEGASVRAVVGGPGAGLAHALGCGFDTGQDDLGNKRM